MTVHVDIHLKKDDSFEASVIRNEEGKEFITLKQRHLTLYFEDNGFENYRNTCRALDSMKMAVQEAWNEKNKGGKNGGE